MRRLCVTLTLIVGATAWAAAAASGDGGPSPGVSYGWDGVQARSGAVRYVALPGARGSVLAVVRVRDGRILRFRWVRGTYGVPLVAWDGTAGGLSHDGRTLVLTQGTPRPGPGAVSRFALVGTRRLATRAVVTLRGAFSYDAVSPSATTLYLIQHLSSQDYSRYRVRAYDLRADKLVPDAIVDRREPDERMAGQPIRRVASADGRWAYTLYRNDAGSPFIHALDTVAREAVCIDLEWKGSQDRLWKLWLRTSHDGTKLMLVRRNGAPVMTVDAPR